MNSTFPHTTSEQEARALVAMCCQAIAFGWPALHFKVGQTVNLNGTNAVASPDLESLVSEAADMAVLIATAAEDRTAKPLSTCPPNGWED